MGPTLRLAGARRECLITRVGGEAGCCTLLAASAVTGGVPKRSCPDAESFEASCKDAFKSHKTYFTAVSNEWRCSGQAAQETRQYHIASVTIY